VPNLVHYGGTLKDVTGKTLTEACGVTFLLYKEEQGGAPLWMETQNIAPDSSGHYDVQLGSTSANGIPADIFQTGQARWLAVEISSEAEQPRVMLVAVAYAMKAADAATIGGLPPSAFVMAPTANRIGTAGAAPASTAQPSAATRQQLTTGYKPATPTVHSPGGTIPVTTAGGTLNFIPLWDATSDIANSILFQASSNGASKIGINTTKPLSTLDVRGTESVRGNLSLPAISTATVTSSFNSEPLTFTASAFNGTSIAQNFRWQAEPTSNFGLISGSMNLLYASGNNPFTETGLNMDAFGDLTANNVGANTVFGGSDVPLSAPVFGLNTDPDNFSYGVIGEASGVLGVAGVYGTSPEIGVEGTAGTLGLLGTATGSPLNELTVGVEGSSPEDGVVGFSSTQLAPYYFAGVTGSATSTSGLGAGVSGFTNSDQGTGVYGEGLSASQNARTISNTGFGVWGDTGLTNGVAVIGTADDGTAGEFVNGFTNTSAPALVAFSNNGASSGQTVFVASSLSGQSCGIDVLGNLFCTGTKNAIVPVDEGKRYVAMSAVESPQNWFEDAGSAQLANGAAVVGLDPNFIQTVNTAKEYQVFLTPYGDCKGLYVTNRSAGSFEVHELGGGTASISFGYRIMALRKNYENVRFADRTQSFASIKQIGERTRAKNAAASSQMPRKPLSPHLPTIPRPDMPPRAHPVAQAQNVQK
jgi:hypothetical protein